MNINAKNVFPNEYRPNCMHAEMLDYLPYVTLDMAKSNHLSLSKPARCVLLSNKKEEIDFDSRQILKGHHGEAVICRATIQLER